MFRKFKVAVVARTSVRKGCKRTEVRATFTIPGNIYELRIYSERIK